jgi:processive 1,2-diacylglycerol beta-glucosyltransferase
MRVVILSTATGQGHNSASQALKVYLDSKDCQVTILDTLKSGEKNVSASVSNLYENLTMHMPFVFGTLYNIGKLVSSSKHHSPIYYLNSLYAHKLYGKLKAIDPDVIVCPHIFSAQVLTYIRLKYDYNVPTVGIQTDYCHTPFWEETRLDNIVIPAKEITDQFVKKHVPAEKILPYGIPVSAKFKDKLTKEAARQALGIECNRLFVVMGGSMGFGRLPDIANEIIKHSPDAMVAALCGHNKKMYDKLKNKERILAYEYIDNVDVLMDAADVLLTKPGGLSATEMAVKNVPSVLTCAIPGCEVENAKFFEKYGMAVTAQTACEAAKKAINLADDQIACDKMKRAQREYINRDAETDIGNHIMQLGAKVEGVAI